MVAPLDLLSAHSWQRAVFTTYALSLSFFEAVVLDALVRGRARGALVLSDVDGVRASLGELGARRVGREYEVEPISVTGGVFHPKLSVLMDGVNCHLLVGSGNLTFGGWGGNLEVIEHLHPSFAAQAIGDAATFFDLLSTNNRLKHVAGKQCAQIAESLHAATRNQPARDDVRLYHSLSGSIAEQLAEAAQSLGGAKRLTVAAPFWDGGSAVDHLCQLLRLDSVHVHSHPGGTIEGKFGSNWPSKAHTMVTAVQVHVMDEPKPRRLHGKLFEVLCGRGRILLSGSANATMAALTAGHNVEACVARIHREQSAAWTFAPAEPPELHMAPDDSAEEIEQIGILRAVLEGDEISGQILTPGLASPIEVAWLTNLGARRLGQTTLTESGAFRIGAPGIEADSWKGGRLTIRAESPNGRKAEGYVSLAAFSAISGRAGAIANRLFSLLMGNETPEDIVAIISWFHEEPSRMGGRAPVGPERGTPDERSGQEDGTVIDVAELESRFAVPRPTHDDGEATQEPAWTRFMGLIYAAFREKRGPLSQVSGNRPQEDDEEDADQAADTGKYPNPAIPAALAHFERLLDHILEAPRGSREVMVLFDLTQYICERFRPSASSARSWLRKLISALLRVGAPLERHDDVANAILIHFGADSENDHARSARQHLLQLKIGPVAFCPSPTSVAGFLACIPVAVDLAVLCDRVRSVRTFAEQAQAYVRALGERRSFTDCSELAAEAPEEWTTMHGALTSEQMRKKVIVLKQLTKSCPKCGMGLPTGEAHRLQSISVATARNCCSSVLVWPGD
jgi:hypothetical protein